MRKTVAQLADETVQLARDRRVHALESQLAALKAQYKSALKQLEIAQQFAEFADELGDVREPEAWLRDCARTSRRDYCAIALASDWHLGEVVKKETVNGLNEFNQAIALRRVKKFFSKVIEYTERYAPGAKTLWLWAGGDFASGYIHPELVENNSMSPTQECAWFAELWSDGLATLLRGLRGVKIICVTSYGNHGRTTEKPRSSTAAQNSFEQFTYWFLASRWRSEPRVEWRISDGYHSVQRIMGRLVRFHHGDAIRFWGGVGGISIPVRKAIAQWNQSQRVTLDLFGHLHEYLDGTAFVCNGSLIGYSPYSVRVKAEYQPPIQAYLVFDRRHGLRQSQRIYVDDPPGRGAR